MGRKKDKPLLHRIKAAADPGLYCEDIAWFFQCLDSLSGNRSCMSSQVAVLEGTGGAASAAQESNIYTDDQTHPTLDHVHFARGRRVWSALQKLDQHDRIVLQAYYEHRQHFPDGFDDLPDADVRSAHCAYRLAAGIGAR